jgi:aspartate kinase
MDTFTYRNTHRPRLGRRDERDVAVLKFGGTSVGSVDSLRSVIEIAAGAARKDRTAVVASAASGVTDLLVQATGPEAAPVHETLHSLETRHLELARNVMDRDLAAEYRLELDRRLDALEANLVRAGEEGSTPVLYDAIISEGERLMAPLLAIALRNAGVSSQWVDSAPLVRTNSQHGDALVDMEETRRRVGQWFTEWPPHVVPVVTGFIGSAPDGSVTTLGRSGSDYSAAVLAAALEASRLERWTDTDGIYTDDPRNNPDAKRLACIVLETAVAWNQAGRLGMHRKALDPLAEPGIPVYVRCTHSPDEPGTVILPSSDHQLYRREAV